MKTKEIFEKLTPAHFERGDSFDAATFSSLKANLQKSQSNVWIMFSIWAVGILASLVLAAAGGASGNLLSVACIFAGLIIGNLVVMGTAKQVKAAREKLGITQKELKAALRQVKNEVKNTPQESSENSK
jgi:hypothetical protein